MRSMDRKVRKSGIQNLHGTSSTDIFDFEMEFSSKMQNERVCGTEFNFQHVSVNNQYS